MLGNILYWIIKLFDFRSDREKADNLKAIEDIDRVIKAYPSIRVVGRGLIVVDPSDIKFTEEERTAARQIAEDSWNRRRNK